MYGPLRFSRSDAVAMTIQRGRDFGLPSYSEVREALNLLPLGTWADINPQLNQSHPQVESNLRFKVIPVLGHPQVGLHEHLNRENYPGSSTGVLSCVCVCVCVCGQGFS